VLLLESSQRIDLDEERPFLLPVKLDFMDPVRPAKLSMRIEMPSARLTMLRDVSVAELVKAPKICLVKYGHI